MALVVVSLADTIPRSELPQSYVAVFSGRSQHPAIVLVQFDKCQLSDRIFMTRQRKSVDEIGGRVGD